MPDTELKMGDVVKHKSDGPAMTIDNVDENFGDFSMETKNQYLKEYIPESIFQGCSNIKLNACVGNNTGSSRNIYFYKRGFFLGSEIIINEILQGKTFSIDFLIYPLLFNFRHGIELYLKDYLKHLKLDVKRKDHSHNVIPQWEEFKKFLKAFNDIDLKNFVGVEIIEKAEKIIFDIFEKDSNGQVFRYPEAIKGKEKYLSDIPLISVENLSGNMQFMLYFFDNCDALFDYLGYLEGLE